MLKIREEDFETYDVPEHTQGSIIRYVNDGLHPGGFLTAVIVGDLYGAVGRADEWNQQALVGIAKFMLHKMPGGSVGSAERMENWIRLVREEKRKTEAVRAAYEDGLCPDCGSDIPDGTDFGDSCLNCGHVFVELQPCDDE